MVDSIVAINILLFSCAAIVLLADDAIFNPLLESLRTIMRHHKKFLSNIKQINSVIIHSKQPCYVIWCIITYH